MYRGKERQKGVRNYKSRSFSVDLKTLERMKKYPWINFNSIVSKLLSTFLDRLEEQDVSDPAELINRLLDNKEDKE